MKPGNGLSSDPTQRSAPPGPDGSIGQYQYGTTLNVPDPNQMHHNSSSIVTPAPLNPPRPAIMSTPKSSMIAVKNPTSSIGLSPTETRPLLLVTTDNDQPQTKIVPQGRRLPLNGRLATIVTGKQRSSAPFSNDEHQMINETTPNQRLTNRKYPSARPRTALFFSSSSNKRFIP